MYKKLNNYYLSIQIISCEILNKGKTGLWPHLTQLEKNIQKNKAKTKFNGHPRFSHTVFEFKDYLYSKISFTKPFDAYNLLIKIKEENPDLFINITPIGTAYGFRRLFICTT